MITRRTVQGQFLLRPDELLNQIVLYLLGYTSQKYGMALHPSLVMSNHAHIVCTDIAGDNLQNFTRDFFSLSARSLNSLLGRGENLWSVGRPNCVHIAPFAEDVIDHLSYTCVNPVEAELVSHAKKWPGVKVLPADLGAIIEVARPDFGFFRESGGLPESVRVQFTMPKVLDATQEELALCPSQEINRREAVIRKQVTDGGRKFLGAKRVRRRSTASFPKAALKKFATIPNVACKNVELRIRMLEFRKRRQERYNELRRSIAGLKREASDVVFPQGTFALRFWYGLPREPWQGCLWRQLLAGMT